MPWQEAAVQGAEALQVAFVELACLELVVPLVHLGKPRRDPSGSSCGLAGSCLVLLASFVVAGWLFQELLPVQLVGSEALSAALVGLDHSPHLAALSC